MAKSKKMVKSEVPVKQYQCPHCTHWYDANSTKASKADGVIPEHGGISFATFEYHECKGSGRKPKATRTKMRTVRNWA